MTIVDVKYLQTPINILIADDHELIYDGVKSMLKDEELINCLDYSSSISQLISMLTTKEYNILVLDINMDGKNALNAIDEIRTIQPKIEIIILTSYENHKLFQMAKKLDLAGYLLKNTTKNQFVGALKKVINGEHYFQEFDKGTTTEFLQSIDSFGDLNSLSKREKEVVSYIVDGFNEKEISNRLFISRHTVNTHKKNIFKKLNVNGVMGLLKLINHKRI